MFDMKEELAGRRPGYCAASGRWQESTAPAACTPRPQWDQHLLRRQRQSRRPDRQSLDGHGQQTNRMVLCHASNQCYGSTRRQPEGQGAKPQRRRSFESQAPRSLRPPSGFRIGTLQGRKGLFPEDALRHNVLDVSQQVAFELVHEIRQDRKGCGPGAEAGLWAADAPQPADEHDDGTGLPTSPHGSPP